MRTSEACDALKSKRCLEFTYAGSDRVVEVHTVGLSRDEKPLMRAWQVRRGSSGGNPSGWKLFRLDEISSSAVTNESSEAPRPGYRRGNPAIYDISCEV